MQKQVFNKVLVPVDQSPEAQRAVEKVARLAKKGVVGEIVLLHVYRSDEIDFTKLHAQDKVEKMRTEALALLNKYEAYLAENDISCHILLAGGNPSNLIIEMVEKKGFDLIVMGSRRLSKFQELIFGSVSDRVTRLVDIPVLIIK